MASKISIHGKSSPEKRGSEGNDGPPLNPEQTVAAKAPLAPLLIVAGAGTGKTRTLTSRIVHLIENGIPPWKICAITFTNKAAKEMADRTRVALSARRSAAKSWSPSESPFI